MEKGETESSERRVTRSVAKDKSEEKSIVGKMAGMMMSVGRAVLGQQKTEEEENEPGPDNVETVETAEAIFEAVRNSRKSDQITVR